MPKYPSPDTWEHANDEQKQRAARSFAALKQRNVPAYSGPLFVDETATVQLQSPQEVARRTLVLGAVVMRAEGAPKEHSLGLIDRAQLWDALSPIEKEFLEDDEPDEQTCQDLVWRLECMWVLVWALGYFKELKWPAGMCDVPKLIETFKTLEADPGFIPNAELRSAGEILDAQDLTMRIHWAVRDSYINGDGDVPENLDWSPGANWIPVGQNPAALVVQEPHHALNWLVNFLDPPSWDDVDTPT